MNLGELHELMVFYNRVVAPGSSSDAWIDFAKDISVVYGVHPWDRVAEEIKVSPHTADFWTAVSMGQSASYDPQTGERKREKMTEKSKGEQVRETITSLMEEHVENKRADLQLVMDSCMAVRLTLQAFGNEDDVDVAAFLQAIQMVLGSTSDGLKLISENSHKASVAATMLRGPHIDLPFFLPSSDKGDKEEAHNNNLKYRKGKLE